MTLYSAIEEVEGTIVPKGKIWLSQFSDNIKADVTSERYQDEEKLFNIVTRLIKRNREMLERIEKRIININKDLLEI
jgi:hypothetical protein